MRMYWVSLITANLTTSLQWNPDAQGGNVTLGQTAPAIYAGHDVGWQTRLQLNSAIKSTSDAVDNAKFECSLAHQYIDLTCDDATKLVAHNHLQNYLKPALAQAKWHHSRARWALAHFLLMCHLRKAPMKPVLYTPQ